WFTTSRSWSSAQASRPDLRAPSRNWSFLDGEAEPSEVSVRAAHLRRRRPDPSPVLEPPRQDGGTLGHARADRADAVPFCPLRVPPGRAAVPDVDVAAGLHAGRRLDPRPVNRPARDARTPAAAPAPRPRDLPFGRPRPRRAHHYLALPVSGAVVRPVEDEA